MGILNITPDSFYQNSRIQTENELIKKAEQMIAEGADILDIGGYSTRPGASDISIDEEIERVLSAIKPIRKSHPEVILSIDTFRSEVAKVAIQEGTNIINDVSGGNLDTQMFQTVAELDVPYILMHMRGTPATMTKLSNYNHLITDIYQELQSKLKVLKFLGIKDLILDVGFGFAKTIPQNYELLKNLSYFKNLEYPLLAGISRKSMIYKSLNIEPSEALNGTTALNMIALQNGASILRVHDVHEAKQCVELHKRLNA